MSLGRSFIKRVRWRWWLAPLLLALIASVAWLSTSREPSYRGKRLSYWLRQFQFPAGHGVRAYTPSPINNNPSTVSFWQSSSNLFARLPVSYSIIKSTQEIKANKANEAAIVAIKAIGTNGFSRYRQILFSRESAWLTKCKDWSRRHNLLKFEPLAVRQDRVWVSLAILESAAEPLLLEIVGRTSEPVADRRIAGGLLANLRKPDIALRFYRMARDDPDTDVRAYARAAMKNAALSGGLAAVMDLDHTNASQRAGTAFSVGQIGEYPDLAVPALMKAARDVDPSVRSSAIEAIAKFPEGKTALQLLTNCLSDPVPRVRRAATNAITKLTTD